MLVICLAAMFAYKPLGICDTNDTIINAFCQEKDLVFLCHGNQNWKLRPFYYIEIARRHCR